MPILNWEKISEFKHALSQERTILCGVKLRLKNLIPAIDETIKRIDTSDKRLEELERQLVEVIENAGNNNG